MPNPERLLRRWFWILSLLAVSLPGYADMRTGTDYGAAALRSRYASLHDTLGNNQFRQPLHLDSSEDEGTLKGDVYALLDHPFATVRNGLTEASHWCDILILHLNIKHCHDMTASTPARISLHIGKKYDQPLSEATPMDFSYRVLSDSPAYLQLLLHTDKGPYGTSNHRIMVEAIPMHGKTWIHFAYSHRYGTMARMALSAYLNTLGRNKVGFTIIDSNPDGRPQYIGGVRGMIERNVMRYYLAIDAYLNTPAASPSEQFEKRIQYWFAATERYPRQLHELTRNEYLGMKRKAYRIQQSQALAPGPALRS